MFVFCCWLSCLEETCANAANSKVVEPKNKVAIRWRADSSGPNHFVAEVTGLSSAAINHLKRVKWETSAWQKLFSVYTEQGDLFAEIAAPPMLGSYEFKSKTLRFIPRYPLEKGVRYRALFKPEHLPASDKLTKTVTAVFELPQSRSLPTTTVIQIYPSAEVLPENLLKFYIQFSASMSGGNIYQYIHLEGPDGKPVELPFLEINEELWDPPMRRLTLFIDPGRIKRGVLPLEEIGPALEEGKRYKLVIDKNWRDAAGIPLKDDYQKRFQAGPPDREAPDPATWKLRPPGSGTRHPLLITFPEPMDQALALRLISVTDEKGKRIAGQPVLSGREREWSFAPEKPWRRGTYLLAVQTTIEDLAGNNIGKTFEVDIFDRVDRRMTRSTVKLPFQVINSRP